MKSGIIICSVLLAMTVLAGCASISSKKLEPSRQGETNVKETKLTQENPAVKTDASVQEVQLDHLKLNVNSQWTVQKGLDSAAFSIQGKSLGVIEGMAYADTVEAILPNQSIAMEKQKLEQLPFDAYMVSTTSDAIQSTSHQETHIFIFVEPKKEVYDLHVDAEAVDQAAIMQIIQSVSIQ